MHKGFLKAGHLPTLFASFLYFDLSFMAWVLLGPLGVAVSKDLHLSAGDKGLMVATPVLAGAFPARRARLAGRPLSSRSASASAPRSWSSPA